MGWRAWDCSVCPWGCSVCPSTDGCGETDPRSHDSEKCGGDGRRTPEGLLVASLDWGMGSHTGGKGGPLRPKPAPPRLRDQLPKRPKMPVCPRAYGNPLYGKHPNNNEANVPGMSPIWVCSLRGLLPKAVSGLGFGEKRRP